MLTEDDEGIRASTQIILEEVGYKVYSFQNPNELLNNLSSIKEKPDLLLTDIIMPGMNGKELSEIIREYYPDINVLYMSGYSNDIIGKQGIIESDISFIQKPYKIENLLNTIRNILNSG